MTKKTILIVGASGYIGNYLFNQLKKENFNVFGTYCRNKKEGLLYFDLESMGFDELGLGAKKIDYVIIAAAANAKIDESKIHWDYNYKVNVVMTKRLIGHCFKNNITPIYLSSDGVFDGVKGNYKEEDKRNPVNCYGKIRYEVENYLIRSKKPYVILRAGRVFGTDIGDGTLITDMLKSMRKGKSLRCATDQIFTPIYIKDLFDFVKLVIKNKYTGIFHLASLKATNRYEIARAIRNFFKLKDAKIHPCKIDSLGLLDKRAKLTDLNIAKYKKLAGYKEKPIEHFLNLIR